MPPALTDELPDAHPTDKLPCLPSYGATRPPGVERTTGGCGIAGCIDVSGGTINGRKIAKMLMTMSERENGLGAGCWERPR